MLICDWTNIDMISTNAVAPLMWPASPPPLSGGPFDEPGLCSRGFEGSKFVMSASLISILWLASALRFAGLRI